MGRVTPEERKLGLARAANPRLAELRERQPGQAPDWAEDWAEGVSDWAGPILGKVGEAISPAIRPVSEAFEVAARVDPAFGAVKAFFDPTTQRVMGAGWQGLGLATSLAATLDPAIGLQAELLEQAIGPGKRPGQIPSPRRIPGAAKAAWGEITGEGDPLTRTENAIKAYQDAMKAGWGHWFAAEMLGGAVAAPAAAVAGRGLKGLSAAPRLIETLQPVTRLAPKAVRPAVERAIRPGLRGIGEAMELPLRAETAIGRAMAAPFRGVAGRLRGRPAVETAVEGVVEEVPVRLTPEDIADIDATYERDLDYRAAGPPPTAAPVIRQPTTKIMQEKRKVYAQQQTDKVASGEITQKVKDSRLKRFDIGARINEISDEGMELISLTDEYGAGATSEQAKRYIELAKERSSLLFYYFKQWPKAFQRSHPIPPESIKPAAQRLNSKITADEAAIAHKALLSDEDIYMAIEEAHYGVYAGRETALDKVIRNKNPKISKQKLYDTFAPVRNSLRQKYGDTIHLYRAIARPGESLARKDIEKPTRNWASSREQASQYGTKIIEEDVPVENILALNVGIAGNRDEFIVLTGNLKNMGLSAKAPPPTAAPAPVSVARVLDEEVAEEVAKGVGGVPGGPPPATAVSGAPVGERAPGALEGLGQRLVAPLRPLSRIMEEVKTTDNPLIKYTIGNLVNPSVARGTVAGRAATAHARQLGNIDELSNVAVAAALDVHAGRWLGSPIHISWGLGRMPRMGNVLPIDKDGYFGKTGKLWNDVFSNPSNPAYKLTTEQRAYIDDFTRLMDDIEDMRVAAGLNPRARTSKDGWFYVPRQVIEIEGVPLSRPTNPNLQRIWDEATEALETKGTRYLNDPRETALIHVRAAYKEVLNKQLSDVLEPLSIQASDMVPPAIREAYLSSVAARKAANVARTGLKGRQRRVAEARFQKAKEVYEKNRRAFDKAKELAKDKEVQPGRLFGPNQPNYVTIKQWNNRFFKKEDYEALGKGLEMAGAPGGKPQDIGSVMRGVQTLGNTIRFLASVGDFAMPLIHGLPLLARNPAGWGRMALRHHQAFFQPTVQAKLIRDNLAEYHWLARNGVPIGDPEFFAALAPGQGIPIGKITGILGKKYGDSARNILRTGGKQSFGRFQSAYNVGLGYSRVKLLKGMRSTWKGTDAELAQYIRNMTGGLDSRSLGVGPSRRAAEGMWLAFSPRLLRSTIALVADAARPNTPQGREALRTLAQLVGGAMSIYALSGLALGKAQGKSQKDIWDGIAEGFNPLSGRRFLSHNINGDWIGIGGQVRALTQFMAMMYSTLPLPDILPGGEERKFGDLLSADQFENPFIQFYRSRGAPAVNIAGGVLEAFLGVDALPFDQLDGPADLPMHLVTSALPFTLQSKLEGAQAGTLALEFLGLRGGTDLRDRKSQEMFGEEYRHVEPFMQRMIRETTPKDVSPFDRIENERRQKLLELVEEVRLGRWTDSYALSEEVEKIEYIARGARGERGRDIEFDPADVDEDDPNIRALNQRNALYDDPKVITDTGRMKRVLVMGRQVSVFSIELEKLEATWTEEQKIFVIRNTNTRPMPIGLVAALPDVLQRSIINSQTARENHFINQGRPEFAQLSRRLFSLEPEPGGE
jgi:hypothetical protein